MVSTNENDIKNHMFLMQSSHVFVENAFQMIYFQTELKSIVRKL